MDRLKDKVVMVTGGVLGIGRACVQRASDEGAAVAILDLLDGDGERFAEALRAQGRRAAYWHCDVAREDASIVLGDLMEKNLRRGLVLSDGDLTPFFTRPISAALFGIIALILLLRIPAVQRRLPWASR